LLPTAGGLAAEPASATDRHRSRAPDHLMLRIALPNKGRLAEETRELFEDAGLEVRVRSDRALTASLGGEFEGIFVRAQDIPEFVADGAADAGVTGWDLVSEAERPLDVLLDLEYGRCRLVVAARDDSGIASLDDVAERARVATAFPRATRRFFERAGRAVEIVPVSGAAEIAPHLGIADIVVDLTSTGSTLRVNGMREVATVLESSARLITAAGNGRAAGGVVGDKRRALLELVDALASVLRARGKRYLMANVPRAALDEVKQIIPGLNGPTVIDILNGGTYVAVHAVVPAKTIYRTISALKALGGEGILVTRIERLMP
jgi:ATP phosphoribosyltransferase